MLGLTTACGGAAASPTPTVAATAAAVPASPQRPTLLSPVPSPSPTTSSSAVAKPTQAEGSQTYTVQTGDTLAKIADHFYGDSTQWRRIYDANKDTIGENPDALKLDMKLTIPPGSPTPSPTP